MGYYINPPDSSKEAWLKIHGLPVSVDSLLSSPFNFDGPSLPVCLVDNASLGFTAAGICYSQEELECFAEPDGREKKWYLVAKRDLTPYYQEKT